MLISSTTFEVFEWPAFSHDVKCKEKLGLCLVGNLTNTRPIEKNNNNIGTEIAQEFVKIPERHKVQI